jgi:uncharacterized protein involved in exopolysaccharide biosynthesis
MQEQINISQYMRVIRRRKWYFIIPAVLVLGISVCVAMALPAVYKSEATILVERQMIPEELVQSTVSGYVEEHLQTIKQVILSRSNLLEIINRFDLHPEMRKSSPTEKLISKMREDISLEPLHAEVSNPQTGRQATATIAFTIVYEGNDPRTVAKVANTLASQLIEENSRQREHKAESTVKFLHDQLEQINQQLAATEEHIASFKNQHLHSLPELMQLNLQTLERFQERIDRKRDEINTLQDRKIYLEGQLAGLEPNKFMVNAQGQRVLTSRERLEILKNEYLSAKASNSDDHPDVIRLKKQLDALKNEESAENELQNVWNELESLQTDMVILEKKYSAVHPDVIKTRKRIEELQKRADKLSKRQDLKKNEDEPAENPAYIEIRTRLRSTEMELAAAKKSLVDLLKKYDDFHKRIEQSPKVEQQYTALQRNYANLKAEHQETKVRLVKASEAQELEQGRGSQKLRLVDPPAVPEKPAKPNRLALVLIGAVLASGFGTGTGYLADFLDRSVHSVQELAGVSSRPVLSAIPYMQTLQDRKKKIYKTILFIVFLTAAVIAALLAVHVYVMPLDLVWIKIVQKWHNITGAA